MTLQYKNMFSNITTTISPMMIWLKNFDISFMDKSFLLGDRRLALFFFCFIFLPLAIANFIAKMFFSKLKTIRIYLDNLFAICAVNFHIGHTIILSKENQGHFEYGG